MIDREYGHITCPYCGLEFQKVAVFEPDTPEGDPYTDVDHTELTRVTENHWANCTKQAPWPNDPEGH